MKFLLFNIKLGEGNLQIQKVRQIQSLGNLKLPLPEEEEVILEVKEVDKMMLADKLVVVLAQMAIVVMVGISMVETSQEMITAILDHLAIGVRTMVTLVEIKGIEVEVGLTQAQMSEDLG